MAVRPLARRRRVLLVTTAVTAGLAALLHVPAASSSPAPTETTWERGRVDAHSDGDTPYVDIWGDGTRTRQPVRLIDVQATEIAHTVGGTRSGKDWCHGLAAKRRAESLMPEGSVVRLRSLRRSNAADFSQRLGRTVHVKRRDGSWRNPQTVMLREGHVMWFPHPSEWAHNAEYHLMSEKAARAGVNIWNRTSCGSGPRQEAALRVWVHHDANGADDADNAHRNDEYVIVRNDGGAGEVDLGGWFLRDTALWMYRFPEGTRLPAGAELRVHTGTGSDTARDLYWGRDRSVFGERESAVQGFDLSHHMGDGAFLLDPQGDFRAWTTYPCVLSCADPTGDDLVIDDVDYDPDGADTGHERVVLHNTGASTVSLSHLQLRSWPWNYVFPTGTALAAGHRLTVHVVASAQHPENTDSDLYWFPSTTAVLDNGTDEVDVSTLDDVPVACHRWNHTTGPSATCQH
ncbi:MAG: lamin tail domain-containing protein [Actinomycetes bacterium]